MGIIVPCSMSERRKIEIRSKLFEELRKQHLADGQSTKQTRRPWLRCARSNSIEVRGLKRLGAASSLLRGRASGAAVFALNTAGEEEQICPT